MCIRDRANTALSFSNTITTIGPDDKYAHKSLKKGGHLLFVENFKGKLKFNFPSNYSRIELIDYLKIEQKVHLVGYSMGGPIVGYFANENPDKVRSVNFIAPAGYMFKRKSQSNFYLKILNFSFVSKYISIVFPSLMYGGNSSIELSTEEDENRLSQNELHKVYKEQMKYEGFTRSLISTASNFNLFNTVLVLTLILSSES